MSNLDDTLSHPRQCAGCENLVIVNDEPTQWTIAELEYVCEMNSDPENDGAFIKNCCENTAYSGGSFEREKQGLTETPYEEYLNQANAAYEEEIETEINGE